MFTKYSDYVTKLVDYLTRSRYDRKVRCEVLAGEFTFSLLFTCKAGLFYEGLIQPLLMTSLLTIG